MSGLVLERATVDAHGVAYRLAEAIAESRKTDGGYETRRALRRLADALGLDQAVLHELSVREEIAG